MIRLRTSPQHFTFLAIATSPASTWSCFIRVVSPVLPSLFLNSASTIIIASSSLQEGRLIYQHHSVSTIRHTSLYWALDLLFGANINKVISYSRNLGHQRRSPQNGSKTDIDCLTTTTTWRSDPTDSPFAYNNHPSFLFFAQIYL